MRGVQKEWVSFKTKQSSDFGSINDFYEDSASGIDKNIIYRFSLLWLLPLQKCMENIVPLNLIDLETLKICLIT